MASIRSRLLYRLFKWRLSPFDSGRSVKEQRDRMERLASHAPIPRGVGREMVRAGHRPAEWLRPARPEADTALLYLHGGAYYTGSIVTHRALAARIARASNMATLLLEYRLAPEHPFPGALEDAVAAVGFIRENGFAPERIGLLGDSAGGGLALASALSLRDSREPLPGALVCLSPWADLTGSGASIRTKADVDPMLCPEMGPPSVKLYVGERHVRDPLVSPVFADLSGLPPMLIQVGDREILLSDSLRLAENAEAAGVEVTLEVWPGMWHVWQSVGGFLPEADRAIERIGEFLRHRLHGS